jgi:hypothetical protein
LIGEFQAFQQNERDSKMNNKKVGGIKKHSGK